MGISGSKRVKTSLTNSSEFTSAIDSAYTHCISLTQHSFSGVLPYQLTTASDHIHLTISSSNPKPPLISHWLPSPPTRLQVDSALRFLTRHHKRDEDMILGPADFKEWALVLYADAIVGNAGKAIMARVPIGAAGILGIGAATRSGKDLVGAAIGVYALGVAASIYLSLSA
ncbi:hypothetical protein M5689_022157 [Euphorbia peplus]|nr:hypothetical protein M5689_022157 [Euphorbia peplus]